MRRLSVLFCLLLMLLLFSTCSACISQTDYDALVTERNSFQAQLSSLQDDYAALIQTADDAQTQIDLLTSENSFLEEKNQKLLTENTELSAKLEEAAPWFELSEIEQAAKIAELEAQKQAEIEAAAKEAQKGYETGITYNQLARTPDDYLGEKVKFRGYVLQVLEGTTTTTLRIATKGHYDNILLVDYKSDIISTRVLEDDTIVIYGLSQGLYTYESTMGASITIPYVSVDQLEIID